jgi:hypothetical protein
MVTVEYIKKNNGSDNKMFHRLDSYFRAMENNTLEEHHNIREQKKLLRQQSKNRRLEI